MNDVVTDVGVGTDEFSFKGLFCSLDIRSNDMSILAMVQILGARIYE